jgi:hypothetical protein
MSVLHKLQRVAGYVWAAPNTAIGLLGGVTMLCFGARLRFVRGVAEFSGGFLVELAHSFPSSMGFCAVTFGHVILGTSERELDFVRDHEHVHVKQYESWGPLFLPAYLGSSVWQLAKGRRAYRDNFFERQAFASESRPRAWDATPRRR